MRDADRLSFAEIEKGIGDLAGAARDGNLTLDQLSGGTFTITNGGTFGSMLSTPIINAPQSAILGMHNIVKRPWVVGDSIEIRPIMYVALSYDHRIIDGAQAVRFLVKIKQVLEDPARLLLEVWRYTTHERPHLRRRNHRHGPWRLRARNPLRPVWTQDRRGRAMAHVRRHLPNVGCIPSKALLESSELFHRAEVEFKKHGIAVDPSIDIATMLKRKDKVVAANTRGVAGLFKKNGVTAYHGLGRISGAGQVTVTPDEGDATVLSATNIVIATGSEPSSIPGVEIDEDKIVSSTGALVFDEIPNNLAVIGAGVIGMEMGSVWNRLGAKVTVFEYMERLFPFADGDISTAALKSFRKQKFAFHMGVAVQRCEVADEGVHVYFKARGLDEEQSFLADKVLVAVGRRPTPTAWAPRRWAWPWTSAAMSRSTTTGAPTSRASTPSGTSWAG